MDDITRLRELAGIKVLIESKAELVKEPWDTAVDTVAAKNGGKLKKIKADEFNGLFKQAKTKKKYISSDNYDITVGIIDPDTKVIICKGDKPSETEYYRIKLDK